MKTIEKKTWPDLFEKIMSGDKKFDVRLADIDYQVGDILVLREWDPTKKEYTGRQIEKRISFTLKLNELEKFFPKEQIEKHGFVVMSLE